MSFPRIVAALMVATFVGQATAQQPTWDELTDRVLELLRQGNYEEGIPLAQESLTLAEITFGTAHPNFASSLNNLAELYRLQGNYPEAQSLYLRSLEILESTAQASSGELATVISNLALLYQATGRYADAEPLRQRAVQIVANLSAAGIAHPGFAILLNNVGELCRAQGSYGDAEALYQRALAILESTGGASHGDMVKLLSNLALVYQATGRYAEAESQYQRSLQVAESTLGTDHPFYAASLNNLAELYRAQGNYAGAEPLYHRSLAILEAAYGSDHHDVAAAVNNLALLYATTGRYKEAEPLYRRSLQIVQGLFGADHPLAATAMSNLGGIYQVAGQYAAAEELYRSALSIKEKIFGADHPSVATSLNNLAELYKERGHYEEARPLYLRALEIQEKALGEEHPLVAASLSNLGELYYRAGNFGEAEEMFQRSLEMRENLLNTNHPEVAYSLNKLGLLYLDLGKYGAAEQLFRRSLAILESSGSAPAQTATVQHNLAGLYFLVGNYSEAESLFLQSLDILNKALGSQHQYVAKSLNQLGLLSYTQARYPEAEQLLGRSITILENAFDQEHPDLALPVNNLAMVYHAQGRYVEALPLFQRALQIWEKAFGAEHPDVALSLNNVALMHHEQGRLSLAEPLYQRALNILEKTLTPNHPKVGDIAANLAGLNYAKGIPLQAQALFGRSLENLRRQFEQHFAYMSEKERLQFLDSVAYTYPLYFSFCYAYKDRLPSLVGEMYDVLLWQKGLIASSIAAMRRRIEGTGDEETLGLLEKLTAKKNQLSKLLTIQPDDRAEWIKKIQSLELEANDLEKELARRAGVRPEDLERVSWTDVQRALGPNEAAVEFVRFDFHDGRRLTGTSYYAALVITAKTTSAPTFVLLGNAIDLEVEPVIDYLQGLQGEAGTKFYEAFWRPLEAALGDTEQVFLSPDGILSQISWDVIRIADLLLLSDLYDLRIVSSARDVLNARRVSAVNSAVLIGNPDFGMDESQQRISATDLQKSGQKSSESNRSSVTWFRDQRDGVLTALRGTKVEIETIHSLLGERGWKVMLYSDARALEEAVKSVRSPRVLHLATHGFFLPDQGSSRRQAIGEAPSGRENPMFRSGLFFAGANRVLLGDSSPGDLEDGVLTAYEASGLNLQGTELVVLSACETGLGEVTAGEGVFGLRRAFQVAGAEAILMSLWSVPDCETEELMTLFYANWLSGKEKHEALREAQRELRNRVISRYHKDLPLYWGGFVLAGK